MMAGVGRQDLVARKSCWEEMGKASGGGGGGGGGLSAPGTKSDDVLG